MQTFEDVLEWQEPEAGGRAILAVGELSIMTHLPAAAALPPPAPPEELDPLGGDSGFWGTGVWDARQEAGGAEAAGGPDGSSGREALHGTFFEVSLRSERPSTRRWLQFKGAVRRNQKS